MTMAPRQRAAAGWRVCLVGVVLLLVVGFSFAIRIQSRVVPGEEERAALKVAIFAMGSFWRSEAVFGCLPGVVRTAAGYAGGSKENPEFRNLGEHAESVQIEYNPNVIQFRQLLDVFWANHDCRQVFGQGPDVGDQYRSIIFVSGVEEARIASVSKEKEQTKDKSALVTTQIQKLDVFYPAEYEHQKFELRRNPSLLQLLGNMSEEEFTKSSITTKLNSYVAELCPPRIWKQIDARVDDIFKNGWPLIKNI